MPFPIGGDYFLLRIEQRPMMRMADFRIELVRQYRAQRNRVGRFECSGERVGTDKIVDLLLRRDFERLKRMGERETIDADHHRELTTLGDPKGVDRSVDRLLIIGAV